MAITNETSQVPNAQETAVRVNRKPGRLRRFAGGVLYLAAVGVAVTPGIAAGLAYNARSGMDGTSDINGAKTTTDAHLLKFDASTPKIDVATAYFQVAVTGTNIKNTVRATALGHKLPGVSYNTNVACSGVGSETFAIPYDALSSKIDPKTGKNIVTIDRTKVTATAHFDGAGADCRKFTTNKDGTKNFNDQAGGKDAIITAFGAFFRMIDGQLLANTTDRLSAEVNHDLTLGGLQSFADTCPPQLSSQLNTAMTAGTTKMISALGSSKYLGRVDLTGELSWKVDQGAPVDTKAATYPSSYNFGNQPMDEVTCAVPQPPSPGATATPTPTAGANHG